MPVKYFLIIFLLVGNAAYAVDSEFYIPYTETYGYTYDPETGQYVQSEQPSNDTLVAPNTHSEIENRVLSTDGVSTDGVSKDGVSNYIMTIAIIIGVLASVIWLLRAIKFGK